MSCNCENKKLNVFITKKSYNGSLLQLKGTAVGGTAPYSYLWEFRNNYDFHEFTTDTNVDEVSLQKKSIAPEGIDSLVKLTVQDASGQISSDYYLSKL